MRFRPAGDAEKLGVAAGAAHGSGQSSPGGTGSQRDARGPWRGAGGQSAVSWPKSPCVGPREARTFDPGWPAGVSSAGRSIPGGAHFRVGRGRRALAPTPAHPAFAAL